MSKRYGWLPDVPDRRDLMLAGKVKGAVPTEYLLKHPAPCYNQLALGSCTANAIAGQYQYYNPKYMPSRLDIYYNERVLEGTVKQDAGAFIRDGMKVMAKTGALSEVLWPYDISKFTVKPKRGTHKKIKQYTRVPRDLNAWNVLLAAGNPIVFGFSVYESFESATVAKTGVVSMPSSRESMLGGHAVLCIGYSKARKARWVRNSWDTDWGLEGNFWLPDDYIMDGNLSDDFWAMSM